MTRTPLAAPVPLTAAHDVDPFDCGEPALDTWLKRRALRNEAAGASRTYLVCAGESVVGYYSLAAGAIVRNAAPRPVQRNMPDPIPVMVLGRLAVDRDRQGQGIGQALLRDAIVRVLNAAEIAGIRAILVHAISEDARRFYLARGFVEFPVEPMTLCLPLGAARRGLQVE
ncbi:MAG: GNAT family N-acetyltransferase [Chloroflexota bacterium]